MVRNHYQGFLEGRPGFDHLRRSTFELCEFLVDVLKLGSIGGRFPHKVGLHQSCHGLRELRLASGSERRVPGFDKVRSLLQHLDGIELVELQRPDECCGFGGTFSVSEPAVSAKMGRDRLRDFTSSDADVVVSTDSSCLMHLAGLAHRAGLALPMLHIAEVLAGTRPSVPPAGAAGRGRVQA